MRLAMPRDAARRGSAPWSYQEQLLAQSAKLSLPLSSVRGFGGSTPMRDKKPRCATAKRMPVPRQGVEIGAGLKKEYLTMKEQISATVAECEIKAGMQGQRTSIS